MPKRVTLTEVAELAGVHRATAARALNPASQSMLSAPTVRKVEAAARQLKYTPNRLATALRTDRSMTVGVVLPDLTNPMFPPVVRGIEDTLRAKGYHALIVNTDNDPERERVLFETLRGRRVDGLLVATARRSDEVLDAAAQEDVPVVLINRSNDDSPFSVVASDDEGGIAQAVGHLTSLGHRRIGYVAGPEHVSTADARVHAFQRCAEAEGLDAAETPVVRCDRFGEADGIAGAHALLDAHPHVTALMAGNDLIALGVLRALHDRGLRCPQEMSVVGFNDMRFADAFNPPLTTVRIAQYELGVEAAGVLLDLIGPEPSAVRRIRLPVELMVRESTAPPATVLAD